LASDYDGTLAHDGQVLPTTVEALKRVSASGRKLVLATGRSVDSLLTVFPEVSLFDLVVAENGAVLYNPSTKTHRSLTHPPVPAFVTELQRRGVQPIDVGECIVATWRPYEAEVLDVIRSQGLELQVIFDKDAVMILPSGVNKGTGLLAALDELGLSPHNTLGFGDAENDHAFLGMCECNDEATRVKLEPAKTELRRHKRKYATGELVEDKSFYFRGPAGKMNIRIQNLTLFTQIAEGIDDETWPHHLRRHDCSAWLRAAIKDGAIADEVALIENSGELSAAESRAQIFDATRKQYTNPA